MGHICDDHSDMPAVLILSDPLWHLGGQQEKKKLRVVV